MNSKGNQAPSSLNSFENTYEWWLVPMLSMRNGVHWHVRKNMTYPLVGRIAMLIQVLMQNKVAWTQEREQETARLNILEVLWDKLIMGQRWASSALGVEGQWLTAVTPLSPHTALPGGLQGGASHVSTGTGAKLSWRYNTGGPELQVAFRVMEAKTSRLDCPQQTEIWVAAQTALPFDSCQQMPQQNSACACDFNPSAFHSSLERKCCNPESLGEMELLLPRKSRLGTDRPQSGIRDAKQEFVSVLPGITVILYCSFWT